MFSITFLVNFFQSQKMLSAVFILNKESTILIEKQYREKIPRSQIEVACQAIRDRAHPPAGILEDGDYSILLHQQGEIWIVGVCEGDEFALFAVSAIQYIGKLLGTLLKGGATEISVKNDYPIVYQILDYAIDFGYPFLNEPNTIQTLLTRPPTDYAKGHRLQLDLVRPWRQVGVKHFTNEVLVDIIETVDVVVSEHGRMEFCHIRGSVEFTCKLSGNPGLKLVLTPSTHYEDVTFHRCVEIDAAHEAKVIPFIPPDGKFTLMKYRITATQSNIPVWLAPKFQWNKGNVTFEITLKPEASLPKSLESVEVRFELPEGVLSPSLAAPIGQATYESITREVVWNVGSYSKKEPITMKGSASTEQTFDLGGRFPVVSCKFATVGVAPSGFKIDRLEVENVEYKPFKGVKYIAQGGSYEFRTGLA
ncbi:Adaptor complexes medium subunit family protein [Tritrichomonas foetus]|uniref:Adaptor complexes medium subunit family protein n=1 Tax=Tritrichomonas foetus TaxID=1144522 RepID=A0A1J4KAA8_9EUKA|nr:Adaptor complexes medium subunit family protein [Tritrichomonas foetus]|eukprot:OHT06389.1 Adaptor complexes medium subunit family protein [Tritrichomonas foetus]